jgi:polysaccharide biosynthesis protein PslH
MNILFLSTWCPYPPNNGSRIRAHYLVRALAARHDVTVVAFCPDGPGADGAIPDGVTFHAVPADPFRWVNLPQATVFLSPVPLSLWPSHAMRREVGVVARSQSFDAVVAFQQPAAVHALQVTAVARVLDMDTLLCYQMRERHQGVCPSRLQRGRTWTSYQKAYWSERWLLRRFQACTVVAPHELDLLRSMVAPQRCETTVMPNGVDCEHNRPASAPKRPGALIYNGALTYSANHDAMRYFLGEIYPLIRRQRPSTSMTITGSTAGVDLSSLRFDESVRLSGYVDDIRPLIADSVVCVVPLRQGGGTRLKILEAMALGTPVVSTFKGAEGLEVTPGTDILLADEPRAFAAAVVRLLGDEGLQRHLAVNARRLVEERYDWRAVGERFVELVEETVARRREHA